MPKINVYPPQPNPDHVPDRRIEVGWAGGTVQVATTQLDDTGGGEPTWRGNTYVDLDRAGVNNLIRALRTARDKAYGRDE